MQQANEALRPRNLKVLVLQENTIKQNQVSYRLTFFQLAELEPESIVDIGEGFWPSDIRFLRGPHQGETRTFAGKGVHELFRTDMDSSQGWGLYRWGSVGGLEIVPSGIGNHGAAAKYTSGDSRDHIATPCWELNPRDRTVFFFMWVRPLNGGVPDYVLQDDRYENLALGKPVEIRPDGWVLLAGWAQRPVSGKVRIVVIEKQNKSVLLDKILLVAIEQSDHNPSLISDKSLAPGRRSSAGTKSEINRRLPEQGGTGPVHP